MKDDELRARLKALDPARHHPTPDDQVLPRSWAERKEYRTMKKNPPRWGLAAAAAATIGLGGAAVWALVPGEKSSPQAQPTVVEFQLPAPDPMAMCARLEPELLAGAEQALAAEAIKVDQGSVVLRVTDWFKGGSADQVRLLAAQDDLGLLEGTITFAEGGRYLVSASDGLVSFCGFSGEDSPELRSVYTAAFDG